MLSARRSRLKSGGYYQQCPPVDVSSPAVEASRRFSRGSRSLVVKELVACYRRILGSTERGKGPVLEGQRPPWTQMRARRSFFSPTTWGHTSRLRSIFRGKTVAVLATLRHDRDECLPSCTNTATECCCCTGRLDTCYYHPRLSVLRVRPGRNPTLHPELSMIGPQWGDELSVLDAYARDRYLPRKVPGHLAGSQEADDA